MDGHSDYGDNTPRKHSFDVSDLLLQVREAARRLVADLESARIESREWVAVELTDRLVGQALGRCLDRLAQTNVWGDANRMPSSELWRIAGSWLEIGTLQRRAKEKPRGYAGDYELLQMILTEQVDDHPLGRAFDQFFQNQAAPLAVRSRNRMIASEIVAGQTAAVRHDGLIRPYHVVSIGSGPASDVRDALESMPLARRRNVKVTLLDIDPDSLDFARGQLLPLLREERLSTRRVNLFRLAEQATADNPPTGDMIVCSGLCDYLSDHVAASLLSLFWTRLEPGGTLLLGNFAPHNPTRAYMEWIGNWYLVYRTCEQLTELGRAAGIPPAAQSITAESLGVDLFLRAEKPAE